MNALTRPSSAAIRSRQARVTSTGETSPEASRGPIDAIEAYASSSLALLTRPSLESPRPGQVATQPR